MANSRAIGLEGTPAHGEVGLGQAGLEGVVAALEEGVLGRGFVDAVADPGVPAGLDVGGVVVVLGVLDPAGSEGEFLVVLEELVAGAIGADESTVLGVTCRRSISSVIVHREVRGVPMYYSKESGRR